jgi:hypothetical protein
VIEPLVSLLKPCHSKISFMGMWIRLDQTLPTILHQYSASISNQDTLNIIVGQFYNRSEKDDYYQAYFNYFKEKGIGVFRLSSFFESCSHQKPIFIDHDNRLFTKDSFHLQVPAMQYYGQCFLSRYANLTEFLQSPEFRM